MPQSYTNLLYHVVFSTKNREPLITSECETRLHDYLGGTIRRQGGVALAINGTADHVHILFKLRPDKSVSDVLRDLKANASGWLHEVFPGMRHFSWQNGYGAFTVSTSQVARVSEYISTQKAHHRRYSFRDELAALLKANGIEFDGRYI
jgi:putative transposase